MKLLVTVVPRGRGEEALEVIGQCRVDFSVVFLAEGTASSKMMEYFSLEYTKKEVVFSFINSEDEREILDHVNENLQLEQKKQGIAYTISINSMNRLAFKNLMRNEDK